MKEYMWVVWLGVFVLTLVIEGATVQLASIFFTLGALLSLIISFGAPVYVQIIVFTVSSVISLVILRPLVQRVLMREKRMTNVDEAIGKTIILTKDYKNPDCGETKLNGLVWNVVNVDDKIPLKKGDEACIVSIEGNKLIVKKKED